MRCIFRGIGASGRLHGAARSGSHHDPGEQRRHFWEKLLTSGELDEKEIDQVYAVNLRGVYLMCQAVIKGMLEASATAAFSPTLRPSPVRRGNPRLLCSIRALKSRGVICLSKSLAKEVACRGDITVNSIAPAVVQTHILDTIPKETVDYKLSRITVGRTGKIEEIAALVHYLVSAEASFTTGQCYDISGGRATY